MPHALTLTLLLLPSLLFTCHVAARNPLILPSVGLADPHVRVINGSIFMFATHDDSANSSDFLMRNWWVWTSPNLVEWSVVSVLDPHSTCLRSNFSECWATDAAANASGTVAFYVSLGPDEIGVVTSEGAGGPWRDVLGRPLVAKGQVDTEARDPSVRVLHARVCVREFMNFCMTPCACVPRRGRARVHRVWHVQVLHGAGGVKGDARRVTRVKFNGFAVERGSSVVWRGGCTQRDHRAQQ